MNTKVIVVSDENESLLWLPFKTSSTLLTIVFNHFNFETRQYDPYGDYLHSTYYILPNHKCDYLPQYQNYKLICSARNPYERVFSMFKNYIKGFKIQPTCNEFKKYWDDLQNKPDYNFIMNEGYSFSERVPDFFIRTENLLQDLLKINFIKESTYFQSGILEEIISKKINKSFLDLSAMEFYDDEMKTNVYTKYKKYFDLLGYSQDL